MIRVFALFVPPERAYLLKDSLALCSALRAEIEPFRERAAAAADVTLIYALDLALAVCAEKRALALAEGGSTHSAMRRIEQIEHGVENPLPERAHRAS
jgi:hypothetical protein